MTHIPLSSPSLSESATAVATHPENAVVVGMGCRFPGSATSPSRLWDMLCRRESGWSPIERFNARGFYHPDPKRQGSIPVKGAHFLASDPASFDASFFSVPAADARSMDPQQRILLEVTYEALESAGITLDELKGSRTSVFIASFVKDYEAISLRDIDGQPDLAATGNGTAILANRISYFFDLKGPSVTIDTACSGSLVAIDLAIQSLKSGSSDMAIVGGVNMMLIPDTMVPMSSMGFLSPEGKCYTFDSRANGYGRGEGAGIVILKRLSDAVSHNDPIRAEVVGHGVNQDGRTSGMFASSCFSNPLSRPIFLFVWILTISTGITMPNAASQEMNIRDVYTRNDLCFSDTAYVECHGTGTIVGDAMEMSAISSGIRLRQPPGQSPLVIGSIKTNIGHLEGAAGVAGFIKSVLAVEHGKIPPIINFENPRQDVNAGELGLQIPLETMDWPRSYRRRQASINSFGFGGTNAHAVVADVEYLSQKAQNPVFSRSTLTTKESPQPFVFSAHGASSLKKILSQFLAHLEEMPSAGQEYLNDLAYTLGCRRSRLETRIAISASSLEHLQSQLRAADEVDFTKVNSLPPKVCFVFAGQGGVWAQMGQSLRSFQAYRESIAAANTFIQKTYHCSFNIEDLLAASAEEGSRVSNVDIAQIITTTVQVACIDLLASLGVEATYVIGHSSGEIAAAYAAKKITRQFAWSCAFLRGLWVRLLLTRDPDVEGGMISAGLSVEDAEAFLNELQLNRNRVVIACINSPRSVTISGRALEMSTVARELSARKIFHRVLQIPCGYHSPDMGKIEVDYVQSLYVHPQSEPFFSAAEIASAPAMYSTLLGQALDKAPLVHRYWGMNLVHQVQFQAGLEAMATSFTNSTSSNQPLIFIEVGTAGVMRTPVLDSISAHFSGKKTQPRYFSLLNMKQTSESAVIQRLGEMWSCGIDINMSKVISRSSTLFAGQLHCLVDLPSYPWNHENKYWFESHLTKSHLSRVWPRRDLVGARSIDSTPFEMKWRGFHRLAENPWMKDHKIQGTVLYPAAGMIAMVIEAASELATESTSDIVSFEITNFSIHQAMVVPDDAHGLESTLSLKLNNSLTEIKYTFDIFSQVSFGPVQRNASGILTLVSASPEHGLFLNKQNARLLESFSLCNQDGSTVELYETLESIGLQYGPTFRNITDIRRKGNCSYATLRVPDTKAVMPYAFEFEHVIHPATLDSMLHALFSPDSQPMVPVGIEKIVISASLRGGKAGSHFYGFGDLTSHGIRESTGDVVMALGLADQPQVVLNGIRLAALQLPEGWLAPHRNLASEIVWKEDIATLNPRDSLPCAIEDVLEALIFKSPCLSVLQIGWSVTQSPDLLLHLSTRCRHLKLTAQGHISQPLDDEFLKRSNIQHKIVDTFDKQTQLAKSYDLVIVCNQDGIDIASLQARLSSHGVMLLTGSLAKVKACLQLNQPLVDFSRAFAVSCFGDDLTLIRSPQRTGAISSPVAILVPQDRSHDVISMAANIRSLLLQSGITTKVVVMPLENSFSIAGHQCISLCHLSRDTTVWEKKEDIEEIRRLKKSASAVLFVTQPVLGNSMFGAQITGLVRTLISEGSRVPLAVLKLSEEAELASTCISSLVRDAATQVFGELGVCDVEFEERESRLLVPRLQLLSEVNSLIDPSLVQAVEADFFSADLQKQTVLKSRKMMSEADNLHWVQTSLPLPGPGEIVFRRFATLLSSADVMQLKSRTSSSSFPFLGCDFFGADPSPPSTYVSRFEQGSSVVGLMLPQPFSSHVVTNPLLVRPLPKPLSYFSLSAYVAAVAALAGSHPVMEALESFEPSSFVNGHNPGVGKSRYLFQVADRDSASVALSRPRGTIHYEWDIKQLLEEDVLFLSQMIDIVQALSYAGRLTLSYAGPIHEASSIIEAVRQREASPNHGMVVAAFEPNHRVSLTPRVEMPSLSSRITSDSFYVIAGAPRGLAGSIGRMLVNCGARRLAFLSRSAGTSVEDKKLVMELEALGAVVRVLAVDLTNCGHVAAIASTLMQLGGVKGVIQCAGVLQDCVFDSMTQDQWDEVMKPKVQGTQNLVAAFTPANTPLPALPWFLFLSSAAGVIGNRGQANYAAANTWQDAFALALRTHGICATALAFGPVMGPGMIARNPEVMRALKANGFFGIRHDDFLRCVRIAVAAGDALPAHMAFGLGSGGLQRQMKTADPYWLNTAIYRHLALVDVDIDNDMATENDATQGTSKKAQLNLESVESVQQAIVEALAERLEIAPSSIDVERSMLAYGLDSFSGFWLRKWVEDNMGVEILVFEIIGDVTLAALAQNVVRRWQSLQETKG
ncbi:Highly reducing polyketide synthase azaB [Ceratocystis fimbriata CBS 114723]|uniref:Highly reducing polyketide synthase azaB n=1 Tax=Ceratocystis fimbriata CBS 114723 TaxID=1035309 RepID=A0A2C5WV75_9PEZI|nr:Highly reducing polyketide synthase azaB [Ceratocystis fimbriata CBS 114723]